MALSLKELDLKFSRINLKLTDRIRILEESAEEKVSLKQMQLSLEELDSKFSTIISNLEEKMDKNEFSEQFNTKKVNIIFITMKIRIN